MNDTEFRDGERQTERPALRAASRRFPLRSLTWLALCQCCLLLSIIGVMASSTGCGYKLVGQGITLPKMYWRMAIPVFENKTPQQEIAEMITLAVIDAFSRRGELEIVTEEASTSILRGEISVYREIPQNISTTSSLAKSYRIFITASVRLIDKQNNSVYWEDKKMYFSQDYDVSDYLGQTEADQREARLKAAEDFADRLVSVVLEGF